MRFCKYGWHGPYIREHRTFSRVVTDEGERQESSEEKECVCGEIIKKESQQNTKSKITVSHAEELGSLNVEEA